MSYTSADELLKDIADFWWENHPEMDALEELREWNTIGGTVWKFVYDPPDLGVSVADGVNAKDVFGGH